MALELFKELELISLNLKDQAATTHMLQHIIEILKTSKPNPLNSIVSVMDMHLKNPVHTPTSKGITVRNHIASLVNRTLNNHDINAMNTKILLADPENRSFTKKAGEIYSSFPILQQITGGMTTIGDIMIHFQFPPDDIRSQRPGIYMTGVIVGMLDKSYEDVLMNTIID